MTSKLVGRKPCGVMSTPTLNVSLHSAKATPVFERVMGSVSLEAITLKCLEGFVHAFGELAASVLPSNKREKDLGASQAPSDEPRTPCPETRSPINPRPKPQNPTCLNAKTQARSPQRCSNLLLPKDHDARLLLLMDHVLSLRGEKLDKTQPYLLEKLSSAPNVVFPDHQVAVWDVHCFPCWQFP